MTRKKIFSTIGIAYFFLAALSLVISYVLSFVLQMAAPRVFYLSIMTWILSFAPLYLVGMPVCARWMKRLPKMRLLQSKITAGKWMSVLCICLVVMFAGNMIGNGITTMLGSNTSLDMTFDLQEMLLEENPGMVFLFSVILAPILEELFFRKVLIDRAIVFGDKTAIFLSGLMFGLFHGNLYQVFYAFGLGCVFAYVYIRTGNIKYTISLHMAINLLGGFISTLFLKHLDMDVLLSEDFLYSNAMFDYVYAHMGILAGYGVYVIFLFVLGIIGLVKLIQSIKTIRLKPGEYSAPSQQMVKNMFGNVGMWLFIAVCVFEFVIGMLPLA